MCSLFGSVINIVLMIRKCLAQLVVLRIKGFITRHAVCTWGAFITPSIYDCIVGIYFKVECLGTACILMAVEVFVMYSNK